MATVSTSTPLFMNPPCGFNFFFPSIYRKVDPQPAVEFDGDHSKHFVGKCNGLDLCHLLCCFFDYDNYEKNYFYEI